MNDPAGRIARVIIQNAVTEIVLAWSDASHDVERAIDSVVSCFCHPALLNPSSKLHQDMFNVVRTWVNEIPQEKKNRIMQGLTSDGVKQGLHHDNEILAQDQAAGGHGHTPSPQQRPPQNDITIGGLNISQGAQVLGIQNPVSFLPGSSSREVSTTYTQRETYQRDVPSTQYGGTDSYSRTDSSNVYARGPQRSEYDSTSSYDKGPSSYNRQDDTNPRGREGMGPSPVIRQWPYNIDYHRTDDYNSREESSRTSHTTQSQRTSEYTQSNYGQPNYSQQSYGRDDDDSYTSRPPPRDDRPGYGQTGYGSDQRRPLPPSNYSQGSTQYTQSTYETGSSQIQGQGENRSYYAQDPVNRDQSGYRQSGYSANTDDVQESNQNLNITGRDVSLFLSYLIIG